MRLRVATANTKLGQAVRNPRGLEPIFDYDAWLLQEVHSERDNLGRLLSAETDLVIAHAADDMGLAIAVRKNLDRGICQTDVIRQKGKLGLWASSYIKPAEALAFRQRARGIIAVTVNVAGIDIDLATGHPPIPHDLSHTSHIEKIAPVLNTLGDALIFGGDMNHWPGPKTCDKEMAREAALVPVDIGNRPTWHARKSRQRPVARILEHCGISLDGQLDALYTRGLHVSRAEVMEIDSDHSAITADVQIAA